MINERNNPIVNKHLELQIKTLQNAPIEMHRQVRMALEIKGKTKARSNAH
jgi:hypothetical protein